jgi:hypothetical protein
MKLDVGNRIRLLGILPEKGNLLTLKIVSTLRGDLSFSEKDHKDFKIVAKADRITWAEDATEKDITIGDQAKKLIMDKLKEMDEKEELALADLALWDKFVGEE